MGLFVVQFLAVLASIPAIGAGTGYFGSIVLRATGHETLGVLEATRAGAVGASILLSTAVLALVLALLILILLLLICMCCGWTSLWAIIRGWSRQRAQGGVKLERMDATMFKLSNTIMYLYKFCFLLRVFGDRLMML